MKNLISFLLMHVALHGCSAQDFTAEAKRCVAVQLGDRQVTNLAEREFVAQRCDAAIRDWAFAATQRAYGSAFNPQDSKVRTEYQDRKQAIMDTLMPLDGGPMHL